MTHVSSLLTDRRPKKRYKKRTLLADQSDQYRQQSGETRVMDMPSVKMCPITHRLPVTLFNNSKFLRLVFKYRGRNCGINADRACASVPAYGKINVRHRQQETSQVFTACLLAKLNSSQVGRHAGGKD